MKGHVAAAALILAAITARQTEIDQLRQRVRGLEVEMAALGQLGGEVAVSHQLLLRMSNLGDSYTLKAPELEGLVRTPLEVLGDLTGTTPPQELDEATYQLLHSTLVEEWNAAVGK